VLTVSVVVDGVVLVLVLILLVVFVAVVGVGLLMLVVVVTASKWYCNFFYIGCLLRNEMVIYFSANKLGNRPNMLQYYTTSAT